MNTTRKQRIATDLDWLAGQTSQSHMARLLEVSTATISQILNNNWNLIANDMWRITESKLFIDPNWNTVQIENTKIINQLLKTAQQMGISVAISDHAGKSKSETYKHYWKQNIAKCVYVQCETSWTKKTYLKALLLASGKETYGKTEELLKRFKLHLMAIEGPIVIIDQCDKLKDPQLDLYMDLYNDLDGKCAFVISGVKALEKRILKGVQRDKIGYAEFYSRICRKFIELDPISYNDVKLICEANGVTDPTTITYIYNNCEGDLRRVRRDIDIEKIKLKKASKKTAAKKELETV